ncbi:hypothetical protein N7513_007016 [Penicillium frequentans]|nr:hypothetical protein N7513_007016 [Penicillium glabrum]
MPSSSKVVLYWHRTDLRLHDSPALHAALALETLNFHSSLDVGSALCIPLPCAADRSPKAVGGVGVTHLVFEKDTDSYARARDEEVLQLAEKAGVEVIVKMGRNLFDPDELAAKNGGKATMSMSQDWEKMKLDNIKQDGVEAEPDLNADYRTSKDKQYTAIMGPKNDFGVPTLEEIGIQASTVTTPHRGGETEALKLLSTSIKNEEYIGHFEKPKTSPADFEPQSTTLLSPHHHFGTLSAAVGPTFSTTYGNPVVRLVDWHLQSKNLADGGSDVDPETGDRDYNVDSADAEEWFIRWKEGRTGFPWIDALMRQLRQEGWIHHLGRHSVACFLTRGGCYVSWEQGAEVFEELLIDLGSEGHFVRKYCPELAQFDKKFIYEPWKAPIADQKKWGCRVTGDRTGSSEGQTYPKPMFDFDQRRQICLDSMKNAYDVGLHGADEEVMTGSWREKFDVDEKPPNARKQKNE